ncbi:Por secretion system C-terminal sorting domain-containing protein [Chishuiella changwenlii]|uniref:Por secretion system C-terminal sorting domain-containing protein n=1 Tax=Chishuiella changwenlii TaxID=1434701 RepID=A0A1M6Z470_9FLAO|nr:T9SS type A sorting domain-containing protein [Chishuiella changwenlii]GGE87240.1 hypothetical protein GCM10010984_01300 [Chishuiella changwenlii]SHL25200.1 Por secretion system C-terminal sorting domain-containing protein [Chishuiella changwenlii]
MKKSITLLSCLSLSIFAFSQKQPNYISFEPTEGYRLGNIDGQGNWTVAFNQVSEVYGAVKTHVVTNEFANDGNHSLLIAQDHDIPPYNSQTAEYNLPSAQDKDIEFYIRPFFDVNSEYVIDTEGIEEFSGEYISFNKDANGIAYVSVFDRLLPKFITTDFILSSDTWYKVNINYNKAENKVEYKFDDVVVYTKTAVKSGKMDYKKIKFSHNNNGTKMYIDDLSFKNDLVLSVSETRNKTKVAVYPNPTSDIITIQNIEGEVQQITLGNINGQTVRHIKTTDRKIDLRGLPNGTYLLKIKTDRGFFTEKILKK